MEENERKMSQKMYVMRILIKLLEFLCCFGKNVVKKEIKMNK